MKSSHITKILDRAELSRMSDAESAAVGRHVKECVKCRRAYLAAQIASALLKEKSLAVPIAPPPFFPAKVLNAWRTRAGEMPPAAFFRRWWQTSATLVWLMLTLVFGLITVGFIHPHSDVVANRQELSEMDLYSTENVIINEKPTRTMTTEQVFETLDDNY